MSKRKYRVTTATDSLNKSLREYEAKARANREAVLAVVSRHPDLAKLATTDDDAADRILELVSQQPFPSDALSSDHSSERGWLRWVMSTLSAVELLARLSEG